MNKLKLKKSDVVFEQETHVYTLGDKKLKGVTGMLSAMLFQDKYAGVSEEILAKAAAYGSGVHEGVELLETIGANDLSVEVANYIKLKNSLELTFQESEYLVSDNEDIASSIDLVFTDKNGKIVLADIKTTYGGLDAEYLSWQLSVYAYLFEQQNPGLTVDRIAGIWLRHEESDWKLLNRRSDEDVKQLIFEYANGLPCTLSKSNVPMEASSLADAIAEMESCVKRYTARRDELKEKMMEVMKANNVDKVEIDGRILVTLVAPTTRESIDSKALKADHPEIYAGYLKTSTVKESLKITVREPKA